MRSLACLLVVLVSNVQPVTAAPAKNGNPSAKAPAPKATPAPAGIATIAGVEPASFPRSLGALQFGMTVDEVRTTVPTVIGRAKIELRDGYGSVFLPLVGDTNIQLAFSKGRLFDVQWIIPRPSTDAVAELVAVWGASMRVKAELGDEHLWRNANIGMQARAKLRPRSVEISYRPFATLASLIGSGKARLAVERLPLLGASRADVLAAYARSQIGESPDHLSISIPEIDEGPLDDRLDYGRLEVHLKDNRVVLYDLVFRVAGADVANALRVHLGSMFGSATRRSPPFENAWAFVGPPKMTFTFDPETKIVSIQVDGRTAP